MSKTVIPVLAIWAAALGSAGALAYTLNRPPTPVATVGKLFESAPASMALSASETPTALPNEETEVAPVVIVHKATHRHAYAAAHVRELSDMRCGAWSTLIQGMASQQVRRCE
jgi:hypothetical protein